MINKFLPKLETAAPLQFISILSRLIRLYSIINDHDYAYNIIVN